MFESSANVVFSLTEASCSVAAMVTQVLLPVPQAIHASRFRHRTIANANPTRRAFAPPITSPSYDQRLAQQQLLHASSLLSRFMCSNTFVLKTVALGFFTLYTRNVMIFCMQVRSCYASRSPDMSGTSGPLRQWRMRSREGVHSG